MNSGKKDTTHFPSLQWRQHPLGGEIARLNFPNGYTASVLRGGHFYTAGGTYEIAVMRDGNMVYDTPITDDVLGYLSLDEAERAISEIASLPPESQKVAE